MSHYLAPGKRNLVWHVTNVMHGDMIMTTPNKQLMEQSEVELGKLHEQMHKEGGEHAGDKRRASK